ncbi:carbonic anhydrase [Phakopsora pachyrhizi]|uniref:Carbonic anhydrase n=1 Tax=Phakopsora pachyrhizi TaxID=170000 RepID=A0AAV0AUH8_PHAPC|nr:carbonic anhydrase [Phakopsora pachyrhizi]KAI8447980.1 carbonic anhydrase [Phakopsora pachyrhizi]CAH7672095.1 carbonic anhydrase [Phakopsora pachyrhizi]
MSQTTNLSSLGHFLERNRSFISNRDPSSLAKHSEGQSPSVFWLGCSDSRVPESLVIGADIGEVFVHRNVANLFNPSDTSATAALAYAVNNLKVNHVVVVGHEFCGGCAAALASASSQPTPASSNPPADVGTAAIVRWIEPIVELARLKKKENPNVALTDIVKANVNVQVQNLINHEVVQKAWKRGQPLSIHGWVYDISQGKITDQGISKNSCC